MSLYKYEILSWVSQSYVSFQSLINAYRYIYLRNKNKKKKLDRLVYKKAFYQPQAMFFFLISTTKKIILITKQNTNSHIQKMINLKKKKGPTIFIHID